jgi:cell division protein FtsB
MLKIKLLAAVCLGTAVYVFVSLFGGQDGLWAARQLLEQRQEINIRTNEVVSVNQELVRAYTALKQDPDIIASYARNLGYVSGSERMEEKLVKINGLSSRIPAIYDPGMVQKRHEIAFIPEWLCKLSGVIVGSLAFIAFMLIPSKHHAY